MGEVLILTFYLNTSQQCWIFLFPFLSFSFSLNSMPYLHNFSKKDTGGKWHSDALEVSRVRPGEGETAEA